MVGWFGDFDFFVVLVWFVFATLRFGASGYVVWFELCLGFAALLIGLLFMVL